MYSIESAIYDLGKSNKLIGQNILFELFRMGLFKLYKLRSTKSGSTSESGSQQWNETSLSKI